MKHPFLLTLTQWIGVACLMASVAAIAVFIWLLPQPSLPPLAATDTIAETPAYTQKFPTQRRSSAPRQVSYCTFDPNTADSITLLRNGLKPWQAHNLIKYRQKGGVFRRPEDLKRLYGLTKTQYQSMRPYVRISRGKAPEQMQERDTFPRDTFPKYISHKRDTILELNTADTTQLQMLRGIGRWTAVQIVRYRQQLGGYYSPIQLREIPHINQQMLDTVLSRFTADTTLIKTLPVNRISVAQLQRHPYLSFTQAKTIYELRRNRITLHSLSDLHNIPSLPDSTISRISHYLSFE